MIELLATHVERACSDEIVPLLSLDDLANQACWSKEHFARTWTAIYGEPPISTARRILLIASIDRLLDGTSVSQVADCAGFASVQAFCHAFRRQFGMSASEFIRLGSSMRQGQSVNMLKRNGSGAGEKQMLGGLEEQPHQTEGPIDLPFGNYGSPPPPGGEKSTVAQPKKRYACLTSATLHLEHRLDEWLRAKGWQ